jgi:hypothetical protein
MRFRVLTFAAALIALALVPSTAAAAPKKIFFKFSATAYSVNEGGSFDFTVLRSGNTTATASVNLGVAGSPTTTASGFTVTPTGTLNFAANETRKTIHVTTADNSTFDGTNKVIGLTLTGASAGGQIKTPSAKVTILENDGAGTIDFASASYNVVEGAGLATVTLTRSSATNITSTVNYTTVARPAAAGNATAGVDYMTSSGTATFGPGQVTQTFQVPVLDDSISEGNEALDVSLSAPTSTAGTPNLGPNNSVPASLTIIDDDSTYAFSSALYSVNENDGSGQATITVTRGGVTSVPGSVNYATSNGTASAPGDYTAALGTLNFAAGETSKTFNVAVVNDTEIEPTETVNLALTDTQSSVTLSTATLNILDNDNPAASVQLSNTAYSVDETGGSVDVTIALSHSVDGDLTVNYVTGDAGTDAATADADYTTTTGSVTFLGNTNAPGGQGETSKTISIPILDDAEVEGTETFGFTISLPGGSTANLATPSSATITINDDDLAGDFEFSSLRYDVAETGDHATVTVRRVGGSSGTASVDYWTTDGSATAPADYAASTGTLTFANGETTKAFTVPVVWDGAGEGDETVNLALANPSAGSDLANNSASVIHIGDDGASGPVQFSASSYSVNEAAGTVTITVTRSGGSLGGPVTVDYTTSPGTASSGSDYVDTSGTLTFGAGEATKTFELPIVDDSTYEGDETIAVTLSNPGGGTQLGSPASASVSISDDDPAPAGTNLQSSPADPNPAGSQTAASDKRAPKVTLSAKKVQKAFKAKLLALAAKCDENCKLAVVAKVGKGREAITLGKTGVKAARGQNAKLKLKLSKKALAKLAKVLKRGKAKVTISVVASDAAGNKRTVARAITVKQ